MAEEVRLTIKTWVENIINEIKKCTSRFKLSRFKLIDKRISVQEHGFKDIQFKEQKGKRMRKNEHSYREIWNILKHTNKCIIEITELEERKDEYIYFNIFLMK